MQTRNRPTVHEEQLQY